MCTPSEMPRLQRIRWEGLFDRFDYDLTLPDSNIVFLHGLNGCGKSTTLRAIHEALNSDDSVPFWTTLLGTAAFKRFSLAFSGGGSYGIKRGESVGCQGPLPPCVQRPYARYADPLRRARLAEVLRGFFGSAPVDVSPTGVRLRAPNGKALNGWDLSAGEAALIDVLTTVCTAPKGSIVLLDNPEDKLHIAWAERLAPALRKAADEFDLQLIIATHSPAIIGDNADLMVSLGGAA